MKSINFNLNPEKAKAAVLYIAENISRRDIHRIFKILYFAEKDHLIRYGRPITGDNFVAMNFGPVPSRIYDTVKEARTKDVANIMGLEWGFGGAIEVQDNNIIPQQHPNLDEFSDSDIECLDISIQENKDLNFTTRTDKSHDSAWQKTYKESKNSKMDFLDIAVAGGADDEKIAAIKQYSETSRITLR